MNTADPIEMLNDDDSVVKEAQQQLQKEHDTGADNDVEMLFSTNANKNTNTNTNTILISPEELPPHQSQNQEDKKDVNLGDVRMLSPGGPHVQSRNEEEKEDEVQVLTSQQAGRELRHKRKRRLYRLLKMPGVVPSFLAVLSERPEEDKEDDESIPPPVVVIDVDEYLGLKAKPPMTFSSMPLPSIVNSSVPAPVSSFTTTPAEEGWYEGVRLMSMSEDVQYLSELQQWIRHNLEYFSATELDVQVSQAGRRTPTVRGKVGIRCIHCARNVLPKLKAGQKAFWPPGSISYPLNINGLYSVCIQKPQLHFEHCPFLPHDSKLRVMLQDSRANQLTNTPTGKRKRLSSGMSTLLYWTISCNRIGLVEIPTGLRFSRDMSLEPLAFETCKVQVERDQPQLVPKQSQLKAAKQNRTAPDRVGSGSTAPAIADGTSQQVLQQFIDESEDSTKNIVRKSDRNLLTDYMLLAVSQMAVCHASAQDFQTRGKKTKSMRIGLAGFCCRHCREENSMFSCRSFSSAPDNLASAISNSFVLHLQKCPYTPTAVQKALTALKRLHARQMQQLPYGSQRKMFFEMWNRLRAADKQVEDADAGDTEWSPEAIPSSAAVENSVTEAYEDKRPELPISVMMDTSRANSRGPNFPVSSDEETQKVLKEAEDSLDPAQNNNMILLEDRNLVSDYVYLTMRQLKIATPTVGDFRGNRRNNVVGRMAGMCCIHCADDPTFATPSGRSFPSAPDNMASALNSSLYNHMQNCPHLPPAYRRAFQHLRKIHSAQCSSLTFGSQRRYFNKVYAKLKKIVIPKELTQVNTSSLQVSPKKTIVDVKLLQKYSFGKGGSVGAPHWQCLQCRMVPFDFRAPEALHFAVPTAQAVERHANRCHKDGISLGSVHISLKKLRTEHQGVEARLVPLVRLVVADDDELTKLFTNDEFQPSSTSGWWRRLPATVDFDKVQDVFSNLANELGLTSSRLVDNPKWLRYLQLISPGLQRPLVEEETDNEPPTPSSQDKQSLKSTEDKTESAAIQQENNQLEADGGPSTSTIDTSEKQAISIVKQNEPAQESIAAEYIAPSASNDRVTATGVDKHNEEEEKATETTAEGHQTKPLETVSSVPRVQIHGVVEEKTIEQQNSQTVKDQAQPMLPTGVDKSSATKLGKHLKSEEVQQGKNEVSAIGVRWGASVGQNEPSGKAGLSTIEKTNESVI